MTKQIRPKGTKFFISASKSPRRAVLLNGDVYLLNKETIVEGFSVNGISEWLYEWLSKELPLDEWFDDYEIEPQKFLEYMADGLELSKIDKFLYAVRNKTTGEFESARCKGGKYYSRKMFAQNRCNDYNLKGYGNRYNQGNFEVVTFQLIEVEDK